MEAKVATLEQAWKAVENCQKTASFRKAIGVGKMDEEFLFVETELLTRFKFTWCAIFKFDAEAKLVKFAGYLPGDFKRYTTARSVNLKIYHSQLQPSLPNSNSSGVKRKLEAPVSFFFVNVCV